MQYLWILAAFPFQYLLEWAIISKVSNIDENFRIEDELKERGEGFYQFPLIRHLIYILSYGSGVFAYLNSGEFISDILILPTFILFLIGVAIKFHYHKVTI